MIQVKSIVCTVTCMIRGSCNVCLFLGEWITPMVKGDRPPPISHFSLSSVTKNNAVLFGGWTNKGETNKIYNMDFTKTTVVS